MPEGLLQLEHLMQATKLLQLKKVCLRELDSTLCVADLVGDAGRH